MSLVKFIEKHKRYINATLTTRVKDSNNDGYAIFAKSQYRFFHWTPRQIYFKRMIFIDASEWRDGYAGDIIMTGFFNEEPNGKIKTISGICTYVGSDDEANVITPREFGGYSLDFLSLAWVENYKDIYRSERTKPNRRTDNTIKQKAAGIGATKRKKDNAITYVFNVYEIKSISEKSGLPIYKKAIKVRVKRVNQDSAINYVKSLYSYKNTKKRYDIELYGTEK